MKPSSQNWVYKRYIYFYNESMILIFRFFAPIFTEWFCQVDQGHYSFSAPLAYRKRQVNWGGPSDEAVKTEAPGYIASCVINIPPYSKALHFQRQ